MVIAAVVVAAVFGAQTGRAPTVSAATESAWLRAWGRWIQYQGPQLTEFTACREPPLAPQRYVRAEQIARGVCPAERRGDLVAALEAMKHADELVDRLLPMEDALPHTTQRGLSRADPRLSRVASRVVSLNVEVRCWNARDWRRVVGARNALTEETRDLSGFVWNGRAHLRGAWCDVLAGFPRRTSSAYDSFVLNLVAHEAKHLASPEWTEAQVECFSLQHVDRIARLLGAAPPVARRLAVAEWLVNYPENLDDYRSPECRPGGALDETPGDGVWP